MSDSPPPPPDLPPDVRLAEALRLLPVPQPSGDFDDRVLAALRVPAPWWRRVWQPARPLLLGASCSMALTLLLLHLTLSGPVSAPAPPAAPPSVAAAPRPPLPPLDTLLDRPNLCAGSLASVWDTPPESPTPGRRPEPRRHAEIGRRAALTA